MNFRKTRISSTLGLFALLAAGCSSAPSGSPEPASISGIYPSLAMYNQEGECGTGAIVPWGDQLWVVTYGPHLPNGSSDKLYTITPDLRQVPFDSSIGGTPANRMIHRESEQLFIGPYAIDREGHVRTIPYTTMPGRHTGNARHMTDPANKIYYGTMEEGFYEVDVHTLAVKELYPDGNGKPLVTGSGNPLLPGVHGKGLYSGQGVMVFANNGENTEEAMRRFDVEAGVLAEWDGTEWKVIRRNQFTEVTGPGGIYGNPNPATDPIWTLGWDHKSLLLGVREPQTGWHFYRLPKASHSYDGAHGWNTEWPRIRNVGSDREPEYLMTMHGMFWHFPGTFTVANSAGIRPRSAYLKVIGDFARWKDRLVFGCDDSAQKEFLNKRKIKGGVGGFGQSNSNLWFTALDTPDNLGPVTSEGGVWAHEQLQGGVPSEPMLFAGWSRRSCWIANEGTTAVTFTIETDAEGNDRWQELQRVTIAPGASQHVVFDAGERGEWIRLTPDQSTMATATFCYSEPEERTSAPDPIFAGLSPADANATTGGLLYGLGDDRRALGLLATTSEGDATSETGYYEMGEQLTLTRKEDPQTADYIRTHFAIPQEVITIDSSSVLIVDDQNRRWRLPLGADACRSLTLQGKLRLGREVATERDLFSCMGTFYELPAENADGFAKIRPISSHPYRIEDYASYRGMLIMTGIDPAAGKENPHIIVSDDGKAAVWAGAIDDLWKMGKPTGHGGPWFDTPVEAGIPSDPYLIADYDHKELRLEHTASSPVVITLEADPTGNGDWVTYATYTVRPGQPLVQQLPDTFQARWIRFRSDTPTRATAWLEYR
ncbi:hypothetical protein [Millionella massiliensis]|uniref:hypothetical protein n=1 Tax=Millionella massiliensis TaxID=1871023 RepID=UPI0008D92536|nr:hypothetical protein [Millionella massiliensis]